MKIKKYLVLLTVFLLPTFCLAEIEFPELTGRVVDNANVLGSSVEQRLTQVLAAHQRATSNQLVVVTVDHLQGYTIETFGYQLGRHWGIGQRDVNNGVLLIVAKQERKVRIEVGYGLEGVLTDAIASNIIHTVIIPQFKRGNYDRGIANGVSAILEALGGEYVIKKGSGKRKIPPLFIILIIGFVLISFGRTAFFGGGNGGRGGRGGFGYYGGGSGGGYSGGGGFSGGGGSFGGGGASGGW